VLVSIARALAHAVLLSVAGSTIAIAQHPGGAPNGPATSAHAAMLGTWAGTFQMQQTGGMELLVARDSTNTAWRAKMQLIVDHPFPPVDLRDFSVDGKTVTWVSDLMGTACQAKAALDGNKMKGEMVCDARTLTFDLTKKP
jgi:hypothetical protein